MSKILKWILREVLEVLPAVIFFFVAFTIINFTTELLVRKEGIQIATLPTIAIGSLVVGKILLVIDNLSFINMYANRPLIYGTLWKTFIYSLAGLAYRFVEKLVPFVSKYGNMAAGYAHFRQELDWGRFWAVQVWVVVLFFSFAVSLGFIRALGPDRVRKMFFTGEEKGSS